MSRRSAQRDPDLLTYGQAAACLGLDSDTGREFLRSFVMAGHIADVEVKPGVHRIHRTEVERINDLMRRQQQRTP